MITYRAALDVPVDLLRFVTRPLITERRLRAPRPGAGPRPRHHRRPRPPPARPLPRRRPRNAGPGRLRLRGHRDRHPRPGEEPCENQELDAGNKTRNSLLRGLRFQGERGFALLTQRWTVLQHTTASPRSITQIVRAALVLTKFEHKYIS